MPSSCWFNRIIKQNYFQVAPEAEISFSAKSVLGRESIWSREYCVSSIRLNEKEILAYVTYQNHEDRGQLKLDLR